MILFLREETFQRLAVNGQLRDGISMVQEVARSNCRLFSERLESCGQAKRIKQQ